jgi:hypothetical protein
MQAFYLAKNLEVTPEILVVLSNTGKILGMASRFSSILAPSILAKSLLARWDRR